MCVRSLGQEDPLEKGMATPSSILVWRIPWTEEPGGLQSRGSQSRTVTEQLSVHPEYCIKARQHRKSASKLSYI